MTFQRVLPPGMGRYGGVNVDATRLQFAKAGFQQGLSLSEVQSLLRSELGGLRDQALREIQREVRGFTTNRIALGRLQPGFRPSVERIQQSGTVFRQTYRYSMDVTGISEEGDTRTFQVVFTSPTQLTRREIEERAEGISDAALSTYGFDEDLRFGDVLIQRSAGG